MFTKIINWSFYLLFFLVPLIFLPNTSELFEFNKIVVTYLLTTIIVSAWIAKMLSTGKVGFKRTILDWPIIAFLGFQLISLVLSIDVHTSLLGYYSRWNGGFLSLLSYALLYWAFVANVSRDQLNRMLGWLLGGACLVAVWGVLEHFGVDKELWVQDVQNRVFSTLGQPNWLGAYLAALVFIPVALTKTSSRKWLHIGISLLFFITLLFTKSRSGLLAFGIGSIVYWGFITRQLKAKVVKPMALFAGVVLVLMIAITNPIRDLVIKSSSPTPAPVGPALEVGGTESGSIRKIVWTGALRIWQANTKNLLVGTGPETFAMAYYQYRPIEHNATSEWELLYNKAHNEFLNYLATTGILGLGSYLVLLAACVWLFIKNVKDQTIVMALFAGWVTILITNFWGFSVVIVQILLFLLPALAIVSQTAPSKTSAAEEPKTVGWVIGIILVLVGLFVIGRYWMADVNLAAAQKHNKYFQATQQADYLALAHKSASEAYKLNNNEPVIAAELSNTAAYLALALSNTSTQSAQQLADLSVVASDRALKISPYHPNYYKSRARSFILLSDLNPGFLTAAANSLEKAMTISPTDPRLPFNLGVVYKFLERNEEAKAMFEKSLQLKPDFADPKKQLEELK